MSELLRSRHAFGNLSNLDQAIANKVVDEYDVLFMKDDDGNPVIGWIDSRGEKVILEGKSNIVTVDALPETGRADTVYICSSKLYFWDGEKFVPASDGAGVSEADVDEKVSAAVTDAVGQAQVYTDGKIEVMEEIAEKIQYEISHKPLGTLVNYYDREIRVMCPADTEWELQNSGANADANKYYIGFKAYAPEDAVSFKEDLAEIIADNTMYYFEGNEFAGTDEFGRNYSIVWLPVANYADGQWTYYGANSSAEKYIGWYYSVEWYNTDGKIIASDCIRINLSNESCHNATNPYYISNAVTVAKEYTDQQIANAVSIEVIEF